MKGEFKTTGEAEAEILQSWKQVPNQDRVRFLKLLVEDLPRAGQYEILQHIGALTFATSFEEAPAITPTFAQKPRPTAPVTTLAGLCLLILAMAAVWKVVGPWHLLELLVACALVAGGSLIRRWSR